MDVNYGYYNPIKAEIIYNERDYVNSCYGNYEEDITVFLIYKCRTFMVILMKVIRAVLQTLCFIHKSK